MIVFLNSEYLGYRSNRRRICEGLVEALNDYAARMAGGEIDMLDGPGALRDFGATVAIALLAAETSEDQTDGGS
jgi:hypothetical protein